MTAGSVAAVPRSSRWLLGVLCGWTVFVWGNRLTNAWSSTTETTGAKVGSTFLAASFLALAVAGVVALVRSWRAPGEAAPRALLLFFAGWTVAVWVVRIVTISLADHAVGFKVVHAALGLVSVGLAIALVASLRGPTSRSLSTAAQAHQ